MMLTFNFNLSGILKSLPSTLMIMFVGYIIEEAFFVKHYKQNDVTKTVFNMEYQFLKSYSYIKLTNEFFARNPHSYLSNLFIVTVPEALGTSLGDYIDQVAGDKKASFSG